MSVQADPSPISLCTPSPCWLSDSGTNSLLDLLLFMQDYSHEKTTRTQQSFEYLRLLIKQEKINTTQKFYFLGKIPVASPIARDHSETLLGLLAFYRHTTQQKPRKHHSANIGLSWFRATPCSCALPMIQLPPLTKAETGHCAQHFFMTQAWANLGRAALWEQSFCPFRKAACWHSIGTNNDASTGTWPARSSSYFRQSCTNTLASPM